MNGMDPFSRPSRFIPLSSRVHIRATSILNRRTRIIFPPLCRSREPLPS